ncbi:MAG TPA: hypothetical protein DEB10_04320 [Ruminococcaceae bacterium]|nr:hypothetical protein [Oscillospiraceae bacterium]
MDNLFGCLDKVKAEETLKLHAKEYVNDALSNPKMVTAANRKVNQMKKMIIAACAILTAGITAIAGYTLCETPVNYVSLDINPSIELGVNVFDHVVSVNAANQDGQNLIDVKNVSNLPVQNAISELVQEAAEQDYIALDGSSVISVTAESKNEDDALKLQEKCSNGVNLAMSTKKIYAAVYADCSDLSLREEAKGMNLSPGKYKMIKMLQSLDPTIKVEDYADVKVRDIIRKANDLLESGTADLSEEEKQAISDKIKKTDKKAQGATHKAKQNKGNSGKNTTPDSTEAGTVTIDTAETGVETDSEASKAQKKNQGNGQTKNQKKNSQVLTQDYTAGTTVTTSPQTKSKGSATNKAPGNKGNGNQKASGKGNNPNK